MARRILEFVRLSWPTVSRRGKPVGFTLTELLVGIVIAGVAISGLMYMVVQLLETNQRESAKSETQRNLQMALDFINSELREAEYVYGGDCLQGQTTPYCPGIANSVPIPNKSVPILAFWKLDPLPQPFYQSPSGPCTSNPPTNSDCNSGRTHTLVVYFLSKDQSVAWSGKARIIRYSMTKYVNNSLTPTQNYVDPTQTGVGFVNWPYKSQGSTLTNQQTALPTSDQTNTAVLADFVDDTVRSGDSNVTCPTNSYVLTPSNTTLSNSSYASGVFNGVRSFYACVRGGTSYNQDVLIFLRGNAFGAPGIQGIDNNNFLPVLQTQVLNRGILNDVPPPVQ